MRYPIDNGQYWISQGFITGHLAIDLAANTGVPVKAPENGVVTAINRTPAAYFGGMYVVIMGDSGHRHYLGHHSAVHVNVGQRVGEGQHVANVGATGQATGPHVHWEVSKNGVNINPINLAKQGVIEIMRKIANANNWRWRFQRLHWQLVGNWDMSEQVFQAIVGQDPWTVVENWSDHPNADQAIADQKLGELARKDQWAKQIYDLQDALKGRPTASQLADVKKLADDLAKQAKDAQAQAKADKQAFIEAEEKLRKAEAKAREDAEAGESFIRRIGQLITKFFK